MIKGVLKKINAKSGTTKGREWTAYSLCVGPAGNDDNDTWYRYGFDAPPVKEGSVVTFETKEDARGANMVVANTLAVDKQASAAQAKTAASSHDLRQMSIIRQAATKVAVDIAQFMIANEVIALPKVKAKRYDFVLELIRELADTQVPVFSNPPTVEELVDKAVDDAVEAGADEGDDDEVDPWDMD